MVDADLYVYPDNRAYRYDGILYKIGDPVGRVGDYEFDGELRGIFAAIDGSVRVVVECTAPGAKRTKHIFAPAQIRHRQITKYATKHEADHG
ncbi:MAG: hypothetical protein P4L82_12115 [Ancalomicrobiaceae bacterium]|nr:hypothetical protein [Ancalomicrobiaceae bacterium]